MIMQLFLLVSCAWLSVEAALSAGLNAGVVPADATALDKLVFSGAAPVGSTLTAADAGVQTIVVDYANDRSVALPLETLATVPANGAYCPHVDPSDVDGDDERDGNNPAQAPGKVLSAAGDIGTFLLSPAGALQTGEGFDIKLTVLATYVQVFVFGVPDVTELVVRTFLNGQTTGEQAVSIDTTALGGVSEFSFNVQSSECFDQLTIFRPVQDTLALPGTATSGFCISGVIVGASDTDRQLQQCTPTTPQFDQNFLRGDTGSSVAFGSSGSAEWAGVALATFNSGPTADEPRLQRVFFDPDSGFVASGVDGGNAAQSALDANGHEFFEVADGVIDNMGNPSGGVFRFTAFWISGDGQAGQNNGAIFDFSDKCDAGCAGQRYLEHRNVSPNDIRGFVITHTVGTVPLTNGFRVSWMDFRMPQGQLEVCRAPDENPAGYATIDEWTTCAGGEVTTYTDKYSGAGVGDDPDGCCGRLVFGCLFDVGAEPGEERQCLYDTIGLQAGNLRNQIQATYEALGAQVGSQVGIQGSQAGAQGAQAAVESKDAEIRAAIAQYGDAIRAAIGAQADEAVQAIQAAFETADSNLAVQTGKAIQGAQVGGQQAVQGVQDGAQTTRANLGAQIDSVQKLVEWGLQGLQLNAVQAVQASAATADALTKTDDNAAIISATKELLEQIPIDIRSNTLLVVDSAEKDVLLSLLALKDRLRSIDGGFKVLIDAIKTYVTANRIKLERELDLIKQLEHFFETSRGTN